MKTVLVTGACINTGVAIVEKFAGEGWNIVFTGRNAETVQIKEKEYQKKFPNVKIIGYQINSLIDAQTVDEAAVYHLFSDLDRKGLFVETLVLNAADQGLNMEIFKNPLTDFMKVLNTNIAWDYCIAECAAKRMKENGGGNIIFINSNTAYRAIPNRIAYIASKGGQLSLMRALALDLGKYNIRVNAVLPGMIRTIYPYRRCRSRGRCCQCGLVFFGECKKYYRRRTRCRRRKHHSALPFNQSIILQ